MPEAGKNNGRKQKSLVANREGTLFEDDGELGDLKRGRNLRFGGIRSFGAREGGRCSMLPAKHPTGTDQIVGLSSEFSPLKRNKRSV
jgi:hypothetical protein